jgi:hypothetical protein
MDVRGRAMAAKKRDPNGSGNISQRDDGRYELKVFVDTPMADGNESACLARLGRRSTLYARA